jgi:hypothetical protein
MGLSQTSFSELDALEQNSKLTPKASLHKGGGFRSGPPPSWESFMGAGFRPEFGKNDPKHLIPQNVLREKTFLRPYQFWHDQIWYLARSDNYLIE